jgi:CHAT domain-containing protein
MIREIKKPSLAVSTVYFDDDDKKKAEELGAGLYNVLTRPTDEPLGYGPGIPVYSGVQADKVDLTLAERVVLIPVLGHGAYHSCKERAKSLVQKWKSELGEGRVLPLFLWSSWRYEEGMMEIAPLLVELLGGTRQETIDEIVLALIRLLRTEPGKISLFLSHAKRDMKLTGNAVVAIRDYARESTTAGPFFDVNEIRPGVGLNEQLEAAIQNSVFVCLRTDGYSTRNWCLEELLGAKRFRVPTITVELLVQGEPLSSPYAGNAPTLVWNDKESTAKANAQRVVSRAFVEYLRALHFRREAERMKEAYKLPEDTIALCRPPELLDLIQGPVKRVHAEVVIHPDPELPPAVRNVLAKAHPKLRLVTPATAFRALLSVGSKMACPLEGVPVGLGISDIQDTDRGVGITPEHVTDVAVHLARNLISAGAHLVYAGDFRRFGYTDLFSQLAGSYRQTVGSNTVLHCYRPAHEGLASVPDGLNLELRSLGRREYADLARLRRPDGDDAERFPDALYHADMRRVMTMGISARVLIGGQTLPGIEETGQTGYSGVYPGVMEEAWWSLKAGQPLYVVGGLGGAAADVASLMAGGTKAHGFSDAKWVKHESYQKRAKEFRAALKKVNLDGLPGSLAELASEIQKMAAGLRKKKPSWNGLSAEDNAELLFSRDPLRIAVLIQKGLTEVVSRKRQGKLEIELIRGSVGAAGPLDVLALPLFAGNPLGWEVATLDQATSERLREAHSHGRSLVAADSSTFPADHVYLASLDAPTDGESLAEAVEGAARQFAARVSALNFERVGLVTFGGNLTSKWMEASIKGMVKGLAPLRGKIQLYWFENNPDRFEEILKILKNKKRDISVTTREIPDEGQAGLRVVRDQMLVIVRWSHDQLHTLVLPPSGTAVAREHAVSFRAEDMKALVPGKHGVPGGAELKGITRQLAKLLFGKAAEQLLEQCKDAPMTVLHDVAASQLPFEVLTPGIRAEAAEPTLKRNLSRRLAVNNLPLPRLFPRPPLHRSLKVLLVIDPLGDLPEAKKEGQKVKQWLSGIAGVTVDCLIGKAAKKKAFLEMVTCADVLHYCGHGRFDGTGDHESGLELQDGMVTLADLKRIELSLRLAFVNACEVGRVRGKGKMVPAASFAEYFLRSGIEAFLGTYWPVDDSAAKEFATTVYQELANGQTLDEAVRLGREALLKINSPEWANYLLYGGGNFRLAK